MILSVLLKVIKFKFVCSQCVFRFGLSYLIFLQNQGSSCVVIYKNNTQVFKFWSILKINLQRYVEVYFFEKGKYNSSTIILTTVVNFALISNINNMIKKWLVN